MKGSLQLASFAVLLLSLLHLSTAQESINAHEGFNVGMQAGVALAICFSILATFTVTINLIKWKCVKRTM